MLELIGRLRRLVGIQYEYKLEFQNFLIAALQIPGVLSYDEGANTPEAREAFVETFVRCGPSMIFEAKRSAYGALELITEALAADSSLDEADVDSLTSFLISTTRFVGIAEGDGEDFHFMVATYNLAREIARVSGGLRNYSGILTLLLDTPGSGITTDGTEDTATDVVFVVSSTESSNPTFYAEAELVAEVVNGEIDSLTLITDSGNGFFVGQIVELNISSAGAQSDSTQTTPATATVTSISD